MSVLTVSEIAARLGCTWCGDPTVEVDGVAPLSEAGPHHLSFYADRRYHRAALASKAAAVLVGPREATLAPDRILVVPDPYDAVARVLTWLYPEPEPAPGIHRKADVDLTAAIHPSATVEAFASVAAHAVIGARTHLASGARIGCGVRIGDDVQIGPNAVIADAVQIGDRVCIGPGTAVGNTGFGFTRSGGVSRRIRHVGTVVIGDDVEIGANCTIDRATLGATRIGKGTKIDNLVHVAHNVVIGENVLIAGQSGISGSTTIGDGVMMGGQAGISDHIVVAAGTRIAAKAGVMKSYSPRIAQDEHSFGGCEATGNKREASGLTLAGNPARPLLEQRRAEAALRRLDDLRRRVRALEGAFTAGSSGSAER